MAEHDISYFAAGATRTVSRAEMSDPHFVRLIRRKEVLALSFGAMIGWSWVALTGTWIDNAGSLGAMVAFGPGAIVVAFVGRPALVWFVDAGGLGITVAYAFVAASFLALRRKEPGLERACRVRYGRVIGWVALALSLGIAVLYLPGSPAALAWPHEWLIVVGWAAFGTCLLAYAKRR